MISFWKKTPRLMPFNELLLSCKLIECCSICFHCFSLALTYKMKIFTIQKYVKPSQNNKGQKIFQLHHFLNTYSQLPAVKKYSINGAAGKIFGPYYFVTALPNFDKILFNHRYKMAKLSFNTFAFCG